MDRFLSIEAFVRVAQAQSFASAARQLRLSKSVVTTRVQQLEELLGGPLFHRSTRAVRLSEMGQVFFRECEDLVTRTNDVVDQMRNVRSAPAGLLRVHAITSFGIHHMAQPLRDFQDRYPDIKLDVFLDDAVVDPVKQGFDVALQIFPAASGELVARRLFPVRRVFCASPQYLERHGTPRHPGELQDHRLALYSGYPGRDRWQFHREGAQALTIDLKAALMSNSVHVLRNYASEHAAIACLPTYVAGDALLRGELRVVLEAWPLPAFWLSAVYPTTQRGAHKLKLFIDHIAAQFADGEPPWDRQLIERGVLRPALIES